MKRWVVTVRNPMVKTDVQTVTVEADTDDDARKLAKEAMYRKHWSGCQVLEVDEI